MRIWADVYDATYTTKQGEGPLSIRTADMTRTLDGPGKGMITIPATDKRAPSLIQLKQIIEVWGQQAQAGAAPKPARKLGAFVVDNIRFGESDSGRVLSVAGSDTLSLLANKSTLLGRSYDQQTVTAIVEALVALVSGWSSSVESALSSSIFSMRFDGDSVLRALQVVCEQAGCHLREGDDTKEVEVGEFGTDNGVRVQYVQTAGGKVAQNGNLVLLKAMELVEESGDVVNWILPMGAGQGDATLTLEKSTRTTPYTIQNMSGPDGRTLYYLSDSTSITSYGQIEKRLNCKRIAPLTNSDGDIENAANALYDAAAEWLTRHKDPQSSYRVTAKKADSLIRPGDKMQLVYKGTLESGGIVQTYRDIDEAVWVMDVTERAGVEGATLELTLSNLDRHQQTAAEIVVGALDAVEVNEISVQPSANRTHFGPYQEAMDSGNSVTMKFKITDATFAIDRVLMTLRTRPFTALATGAASGGGSTETSTAELHDHLVIRSNDGTSLQASLATQRFSIKEQDTDTIYHFDAQSDVGSGARFFETATQGSHDHDVDIPAHVHDLDYGINRDTDYPDHVSVTVNGETVASDLDTGGAGLDEEIDITDEIVNKVGGFRADHTVVISCTGGQGMAVVEFEVFDQIINFRLG